MKSLIKKLIYNELISGHLLKFMLRLHTFSYDMSGKLASFLNKGVHPKHRILKYKEWFLENISKNDTVIDVGCNTGMMPNVLSSKADFVYGVEIIEAHILKAREKYKKDNIEFIFGDATVYDYSNCKLVDVITLSNVLEHIEDRVVFLKKLVGQVRWKGKKKKLLIRVPSIEREWIASFKKEVGVEYRLDITHFTEYTLAEFLQELKDADIEVESYNIKYGEIYAICNAI